jgi:hypothetical protein
MKPLEVAARFAAFAWYTEHCQAHRSTLQAEASRFAKANWRIFLPVAHEGWGRLLLRVAKVRLIRQRHRATVARSTKRRLAAV